MADFDYELFLELNPNVEKELIHFNKINKNHRLIKKNENRIKEIVQNHFNAIGPEKCITSIYQIYPDFSVEQYAKRNPFLYFSQFKSNQEYEKHYALTGRYEGWKYTDVPRLGIHVLLATIGKKSIFGILSDLNRELEETDFLTIVFDGKMYSSIKPDVELFLKPCKAKVNIIVEEQNLGFYGHAIRNKHNQLEGDYIYHVDDDDRILEGSFEIIRRICIHKCIYLFRLITEKKKVIWSEKNNIRLGDISTQSGIIPMEFNNKSFFTHRYGGDFDFYKALVERYPVLYIDEVIYQKF